MDEPSLRQAVRERRSWNLIHLPTFTKVDLIMQGTGAYDANEFVTYYPDTFRAQSWPSAPLAKASR